MYILRRNNQRFYIKPQSMLFLATEYFHRATMNFYGVFTQCYHPKTFNSSTKWTPIWSQPNNICVAIGGGEGSGSCGFNSICKLNDNQKPDCKCPPRYSLLDSNNMYGNCKLNFTQSCLEDDINSVEDIYDFETLIDIDWPTSDYEQLKPATKAQCKRSCINDCFCVVAILGDGSCWKKKLPLSNGREDNVVNRHAFLKFRKRDPRTLLSPLVPETKKNQGTLILIGSVLLGSFVFINFVLIGAVCLGFFLIHHRKSIKSHHGNHNAVETNLCCFTYEELVEATNGFKEELGSKAFGIVYKGVTQMGSRVVVAVKKLDMMVQEKEKEFKTKPQNILLDDYYNARISDFGLAKVLKLNKSKTNPATIRGTRGYVTVEWFNRNPIIVKVDVYSYGQVTVTPNILAFGPFRPPFLSKRPSAHSIMSKRPLAQSFMSKRPLAQL
ncbi:hypothetical protein HYC85_030946 [Camellia sinensis]|uniref:Protein kinase domain-containing protein n=1 Tax=Camellia sinensis TaxID=4442 RepID=A0A7J7FPK1_CAMSI|nr:hypothetical protein HYC85_030946 [Camellia sinensis]